MSEKPRIKYNQIPAIALEDVGRRMTHGWEKHGDYKDRLLELPRNHYIEHMLWHINQIYDIKKKKFKDDGQLYTGSGDSHALAIACDGLLLYESELERGMLTRKNGVNKQ
jgi:hypothetical protein